MIKFFIYSAKIFQLGGCKEDSRWEEEWSCSHCSPERGSCHDVSSRQNLLGVWPVVTFEPSVYSHMHHKNLVQLVGLVFKGSTLKSIVMEVMGKVQFYRPKKFKSNQIFSGCLYRVHCRSISSPEDDLSCHKQSFSASLGNFNLPPSLSFISFSPPSPPLYSSLQYLLSIPNSWTRVSNLPPLHELHSTEVCVPAWATYRPRGSSTETWQPEMFSSTATDRPKYVGSPLHAG